MPGVTARAVAEPGMSCVPRGCRKMRVGRDLRRSSGFFRGICTIWAPGFCFPVTWSPQRLCHVENQRAVSCEMLVFTAGKGKLVPSPPPWHTASTGTVWGEQGALPVPQLRSKQQGKLCLVAQVLCFMLPWPGCPRADITRGDTRKDMPSPGSVMATPPPP